MRDVLPFPPCRDDQCIQHQSVDHAKLFLLFLIFSGQTSPIENNVTSFELHKIVCERLPLNYREPLRRKKPIVYSLSSVVVVVRRKGDSVSERTFNRRFHRSILSLELSSSCVASLGVTCGGTFCFVAELRTPWNERLDSALSGGGGSLACSGNGRKQVVA